MAVPPQSKPTNLLTHTLCTFPVYTIAWRDLENPDAWARRFIRFKDGEKGDLVGAAKVLVSVR